MMWTAFLTILRRSQVPANRVCPNLNYHLSVAVIDGSELPEVSKFVYLLSLLTSDAKLSVKGLTISAARYQIAKGILVNRYGRKERIIFTHIQQLMNITVPGSPGNVYSQP